MELSAPGNHHQGKAFVTCALCDRRKEKRFCLAVHGRICPQCCGEQREVTLDCPSECPYLQQARQHDRRRADDVPAEEVFPEVEVSAQFMHDHEPLAIGILHTIAKLSRADRSLTDRDVSGALANMAKSYRTLVGSGLFYQESLPNLVQQSLIESIETLLKEVEQQHLGYSSWKNSDVLKALVWILRLMPLHSSGRPRSRGFLDFLKELFPDVPPGLTAAEESSRRIILS